MFNCHSVNPASARVLNQVCCFDGCTSSKKLSSSSAVDGIHHSINPSQLSESIVTTPNGHIGRLTSTEHRATLTLEKSTQTDPAYPGQEAGQVKVPLHRCAQSLNLEDALPPGQPLETSRAKLHRVPGMEEEDEEQEEDEDCGGEQEKELSWMSSVEDTIQPTTIRCLQREESQDGSCSPEEVGSGYASARSSDQNLSSRCGPLSPIQEGQKTPLCVTSLY
ncbi:uncharacterized protein LOC103399150 [Cynoglossus semilaevis]|uniref:uncharacterized protein LOC103399150 n=1 Tax=Cynoglossus semilaevis TaxID=244447 RepID=UPI000D62E636|nr:uncharacterized protein LOC103399150 [Cynoglossus semilaevis]